MLFLYICNLYERVIVLNIHFHVVEVNCVPLPDVYFETFTVCNHIENEKAEGLKSQDHFR